MSIAGGNSPLLSQLTGKGNDRNQKPNFYHESIVYMFNNHVKLGLGVSVRPGAILGYIEDPDNTIVNRIQFLYNAQNLYSERIEKEEKVGVFAVRSSFKNLVVPSSGKVSHWNSIRLNQSYFEPSSNLFSNQSKRHF